MNLSRFEKKSKNQEAANYQGSTKLMEKKQSQVVDALLGNETYFKLFFENSQDYCYLVSPEDLILDVNESALGALNFKREELIGKHWKIIYSPDSLEKMNYLNKRLKTTGKIRSEEVNIRSKTGDTRNVLLNVDTIRNINGSILNSIFVQRDITDHKYIEEKEKQNIQDLDCLSETILNFVKLKSKVEIYKYIGKQLKKLVDDSIVIINSFDPKTDRICVEVVEGFGKLTKSALKILGKNPIGTTYKINEVAKRELLTGKYHNIPGKLYTLSFGQIPKSACYALEKLFKIHEIHSMGLTWQGELLGDIVIILRKNTKLKNKKIIEAFINQAAVALQRSLAIEALQEGEKKYRELFETSPEAIVLLDQDLKIIDCNDIALKIGGVSKDEVIGQYFGQEIVPLLGDGKERYVELFIKILQREPVPPFEVEIINKKGERFWLLISFSPPKNDAENFTIQIIAHDITEHKKDTEEIRKYRGHLEDLVKERTSELEAFAYSVSHDLRAPLRSMQSFAQVLLEDYIDKFDSEGKEFANRIIKSSKHMNTLIENLLSYSRLSRKEIKLEPVNLTKIIKGVVNQYDVKINEKNAEINITSPLPNVKGHYSTISRIVLNLLINAITFVDDNKKPKINIWSEEHNGWIRLYIEDNGIGIAPEYQEKIFKIFERLHGTETYQGTGIGLAIVKKGVERMGGTVGVESTPGKGSKFWVEFKKVEKT